MSSFFRAARALALAASALCAFAVEAQAPMAAKSFFGAQVAARGKPAGVVSEARPVRFNAEQMLRLAPGEAIQLALPNAISREVVFERSQSHGGGISSWVGYFRERGRSNRVIVTSGPGGSYGVIDSPDGTYRIIPGDGHDWLVDMTQEQLSLPLPAVKNDERIPPPGKGGTIENVQEASFGLPSPGITAMTPAPQAVIDLMFVVTTGMANNLGANLMTRLYFLVTRANQTYADSEVAMTLRFVKLAVVNYPDDTDDGDALDAITPVNGGGSGVFANIETLRNAAGADAVAFMRNTPPSGNPFSGAGVAWVNGDPLNPTVPFSPQYMYSVTTGCVAGCESVFIHEVGHNMGNRHDRYTAAWQNSGAPIGSAYGYAFCRTGTLATCTPNIATGTQNGCAVQPQCSKTGIAVQDNSDFADIMAYFQASTQDMYRFSNPGLLDCKTSNGDGVNRPCGLSTPGQEADTASAMNARRSKISEVKGTVSAALMPGSVQFTQTSFSGSEAGGTVTFTVSRVRDSSIAGGGGGAISVQYSVANGSATAGSDFTNSSGTLNWADGDFANKTFSITVANDGVTEGNEAFTATLANLTGPAGVFLGYPTVATGIIQEPWPPGGTAPPGFSSASTPTLPWGVVTDSFDVAGGDTSSFKSAAFADSATGSSSTVYVGNFQAGTVAFAYRVSSFPSNGFFEFLIDGTVVLSDSGDNGAWESFSTTISAGVHSLEWRYRKPANFACRFTYFIGSPPPPYPFPNCQDRAWIDSVSLPPAAAPPSNPPRLANISTRGQVQTGFNVMIGGFVISGATPKTVVIRAIGPSLANFGVPGTLSNPTMDLVRISDNATIASNDNWGTTANVSLLQAAGLAPSNPFESALYITLLPGPYTAIVSGVGGATGVGLVEVYEIDQPDTPLINISTRGRVETADNVMIGGFVIQGSGPETVLIRAIGPSLANFGVSGALANPTMTLVRISDSATLASNDDWQSASNLAQITATGLAPTNPLESAILMTLQPGAYTAIVSGVGGGTGVGLVEVYKIGP